MFVSWLTAILFAILSSTCMARLPGRTIPYSICKECRSPELMVAPGVGFDLAHSYGTSAIRFENGTTVFVGKVDGDSDFQALWERFSDWDSRPQPPRNRWEEIRQGIELARRRLNKSRGLPATEDVGTIAAMLIELKRITELRLGHEVDAVVVAQPDLPGLTEVDIKDAMDYAEMKRLTAYNFPWDPSEPLAAYMGLGKGMCSRPEDIESCEDEEVNLPGQYIMSVTFTNTVLGLAFSEYYGGHRGYDWMSRYYLDLGLNASYRYTNTSTYWTEVTWRIRNFLKYNIPYDVDFLQVLGEAARNQDFQDALEDALLNCGRLQTGSSIPPGQHYDPLSLAARGAAECAKRFQVMTWDCVEPARCRQDLEMAERPLRDL